MILTKELWDYIIEKQRILDAAFMKNPRFEPNIFHREFAMFDEIGEFTNQFRTEFKWWSYKPNDRDKIADEYIDILHFAAGIAIAENQEELKYEGYCRSMKFFRYIWEEEEYLLLLLRNLRFESEHRDAIARATYIMERIGFATEDLKEAYDRKNAENFKRIASGVY